MLSNQEIILEYLDVIQKDTSKVLTNQYFTKSQWIQYNSEEKYFEYEDHVFLGKSSLDVIKNFENLLKIGFGEWLNTAEWHIKNKC